MKISVIMAVHNAELKILKKSVSSILDQTFSDFEFIIIDDINDDNCISYLTEISKKDKRVAVFRNTKNIGLTKSLIKGIANSSGKYIARQDADDFSEKNRFQLQYKYLEENYETSLVGTWFLEKSDYGYSKFTSHKNNSNYLKNIMFKTNPICHSSAMFRRSKYNDVGGYNQNIKTCQDLDLWFKLSNVGEIAIIERQLVERNLIKNSISLSKKSYLQVFTAFQIRIKNIPKNKFFLNFISLVMLSTAYHLTLTLFMPIFRLIKLTLSRKKC